MKMKMLTAMTVAGAAGAIALGAASPASAITVYPTKAACQKVVDHQKFGKCEYKNAMSGWVIVQA
ncbi:hypothetical protein AB0L00_10210 [Actinoallomurus sp. NPDC052308]|uniref:hypothetical protein n=1 Tax=Actinoallomurus sp. NPDC052308 TaxID=3155530 RepID=UPI00341B179C